MPPVDFIDFKNNCKILCARQYNKIYFCISLINEIVMKLESEYLFFTAYRSKKDEVMVHNCDFNQN